METTALAVKDLSVTYGAITALDNITLEIPVGSRCAIVGPNGAGKSSLFKAVLGLENRQGSVSLLGQDQQLGSLIEQSVAYVPQANAVNWQFPARVYDIVMMGRFAKMKGWFKKTTPKDREVVEKSLETMALLDLQERQIDQLSGGQRQRVFIARALAQEAELYLMDEPLAGVDVKTEMIIMDTLKQFQKQGKTSIVVHHDLHTLETYFDYLVWINKFVVAAGPMGDVLTRENYQMAYHTDQLTPWLGSKEGTDVGTS
ncbi:metal ABC transporter ATP-binding protein [Streptococcus ovuberis]|uniref:Metal ABC transporter ATP-binding protein n=1 Tax=Streptococcus ovuberis TaxID=1936207 RepID=A0A7X6N229_9STRE|nr:metal ABC transporter ATP-binding protein [Streptococcus ovuberis]NKZ20797.1 metal ABC transporter ATP-binding protein [Streptococcus ovuberis]